MILRICFCFAILAIVVIAFHRSRMQRPRSSDISSWPGDSGDDSSRDGHHHHGGGDGHSAHSGDAGAGDSSSGGNDGGAAD